MMGKDIPCNGSQKKARVATVILDNKTITL